MMSGMKISVAQNMMASVRWLDTLSHTVRLACGMLDDGMTNGNMEAPAVPMTPARTSALAMKARPVRRQASSSAGGTRPHRPAPAAASSAARAGSWPARHPASRTTVLSRGLASVAGSTPR